MIIGIFGLGVIGSAYKQFCENNGWVVQTEDPKYDRIISRKCDFYFICVRYENIFEVLPRIPANSKVLIITTIPIGTIERIKVVFPTLQLAYCPERLNPGDTYHKHVTQIEHIFFTEDTPIKNFYIKYFKATLASSFEEVEMSKAFENAQRLINISFMNDMKDVAEKNHIDFANVLKLASTRWNFLPFYSGYAGGHCLQFAGELLPAPSTNLALENMKNLKDRLFSEVDKYERVYLTGTDYKEGVSDSTNSIYAELEKYLQDKKKLVKKNADLLIMSFTKVELDYAAKYIMESGKRNYIDLHCRQFRSREKWNKVL